MLTRALSRLTHEMQINGPALHMTTVLFADPSNSSDVGGSPPCRLAHGLLFPAPAGMSETEGGDLYDALMDKSASLEHRRAAADKFYHCQVSLLAHRDGRVLAAAREMWAAHIRHHTASMARVLVLLSIGSSADALHRLNHQRLLTAKAKHTLTTRMSIHSPLLALYMMGVNDSTFHVHNSHLHASFAVPLTREVRPPYILSSSAAVKSIIISSALYHICADPTCTL